MPESKLGDIIATSLSNIKELVDADTIVGYSRGKIHDYSRFARVGRIRVRRR